MKNQSVIQVLRCRSNNLRPCIFTLNDKISEITPYMIFLISLNLYFIFFRNWVRTDISTRRGMRRLLL